jgi:hypothetical protein
VARRANCGNALANALFDRAQVQCKAGVEAQRSLADYAVDVAAGNLPGGISLIRPC